MSGPLVFWSGYSTSDSNNKSKKPQDFWISQATARFTQKTGIQVKMETLPGDATMFTKIRTAAIAGKGPDLASVWSGSYMLSIKEALEPMAPYFSDDERSKLSGWAAVTDGFDPTQKDKILGVPNGSDGPMICLCNNTLMSKAGVDPTQWPVSYDEWMGDLDKIKATGVMPLSLGDASFIYYLYNTWLAQAVGGSVGIGQLATGARNFSDPEVLDATNKWLAVRPYAFNGAPTTKDGQAVQQLYTGKASMVVGGATSIGEFRKQLGDAAVVAKLPDISSSVPHGMTVGGTGVGFIVSKTSKNKQAAVDYIKFLLSADEQQAFANSLDPGPLAGRTDMSDVYKEPLLNQLQKWGSEDTVAFWPDNTLQADLVNELANQAQLAWGGQISATEFLSRLDKKRDTLK